MWDSNLDNFAFKRDNSMSLRVIVGDSSRLIEIISNKRVAQRIVEPGEKLGVVDLDEIDESLSRFGKLQAACSRASTHMLAPFLLFVERYERGRPNAALLQVLDALLSRVDRVDDHVIERTARGRDGNIVAFVDGAQVTETTVKAVQFALAFQLGQKLKHLVAASVAREAALCLHEFLPLSAHRLR